MSKELVISAASHERRVAILEEGQLVEIYIEREKEFALVGSIYKGKVTRVLPGMQSAFVDIGLDGDAFLYVSDVFENLEDYDHGHSHTDQPAVAPAFSPVPSNVVELLPGETLAHAASSHEHEEEHVHEAHGEEPSHESFHREASQDESSHHDSLSRDEQPGVVDDQAAADETLGAHAAEVHDDAHHAEERQPDSNASAPQNFSPHYNPTQNYAPRAGGGGDRGGQDYGRSGDRGGDRGRGGRWGRRGGRQRGGRPQGPNVGGRNLPPSKYASPQGGESRGNDSRGYDNRGRDQRGPENRGGQPRGFEPRGPAQRGFDHRPPETPSHSSSSSPVGAAEEPILLPGESLAKYRGKPLAAPVSPVVEQASHEPQLEIEETTPRASSNQIAPIPATGPAAGPTGGNVPRRFSGGLPRWVLAETGSESEAAPVSADENIGVAEDSSLSAHGANPPRHEASPLALPAASGSDTMPARSEVELSEDQVVALSAELVEAKHEETSDHIKADALVGGAEFEEDDEVEEIHAAGETELAEDEEAEEDERQEEAHLDAAEDQAAAESELSEDETEEVEEHRAANRAEFEANAAHESAEHAAALGDPEHAVHDHTEREQPEHEHTEAEVIEAHVGEIAAEPAVIEDDVILLPGETRAPRIGGAATPREDFPRDSARIGGNPRARFQRPQRGGRDRGRGGRPDSRGGRPDRGGDRGGRPSGPRFERRPSGPGGPRHDRGHRSHSGPPRRPQLISEMLKAGQDVVVQIAKEPLGKKGARITSHVALPGRFLVYMPTVHHTGVSRKIISAENRSRLRRLVSEAGNSYPGGFIVRTAAGGATDDEIRTDIEFLGKSWNEIKERSEQRKSPALLHRDLNLVERILRDYVSDDFTGIWIDNEEEYGKIVEFVSRFQPKLVNKVKLYTKETPIFEEFGIQHELDKALRAKVWLKSGGYIVINHTEALVAIDVNTGKFVGKGSTRLEDTIVKTNLEAVKEIVRQIRLRDLGGIIVVDFIDMEERRNREKVLSALQMALEQDKAPSKALSFNEFGLVCITRKRTKQALERVLCQPCPYCTGSGMVKSIPTLCYEIQAEARKMATADHEGPNLTLRVHPEIAKALKTRESMLMDELEQTSHKHIIIQSDATLHWEQYDIY
ncbi:MAG TPA: Rne/Rng family ribonuclease [Candidatus Binatus sp.]|nr:Rne/Rng family ribonuclease [Candidatus Binatus sp.]